MKKKISLVLLLILIIFLISLIFNFFRTLASPGLICQLRNVANCPGSEICVFSLNQNNNSHAGNCTYGDWKVCCEEPGATLTLNVRTIPCDPGLNETGVLSLNQLLNSHAGEYPFSTYPYYVCLGSSFHQLECNYRNSCYPAETCLASLYQNNNSHVSNCTDTDAPIKICCTYATYCGDGVWGGTEECDPGFPTPPVRWGICLPYENCNQAGSPDECECHDFRNDTRGCNFYDYCTSAPCVWGNTGWSDCYINSTDVEYIKYINETLCPDSSFFNHSMRTCPEG